MTRVMLLIVVCAVLAGGAAVAAIREPRRMLPGVLGLAAILCAIQAVFFGAAAVGDTAGALTILGVGACVLFAILALGVLLIANCATLVRREGVAVGSLLSGLLGLLLVGYVVAVAVGVGLGRYNLEASDVTLMVLLAVALPAGYLGFVLLAQVGWSYLYVRWGTRRALREPVDAVIVLGAGLLGGDRVSPLLASRLDLGKQIFDTSRTLGGDPVLICSGGKGDDERLSEAAAMAKYLQDRGIEQRDIVLEDNSTDTEQNLRYSAQLLRERGDDGPAVAVTSNYHAFRAATLMRAAGLRGFAAGSPTARYFVPNAQVREYVAILRDNLWLNVIAVIICSLPLIVGTIVSFSPWGVDAG